MVELVLHEACMLAYVFKSVGLPFFSFQGSRPEIFTILATKKKYIYIYIFLAAPSILNDLVLLTSLRQSRLGRQARVERLGAIYKV